MESAGEADVTGLSDFFFRLNTITGLSHGLESQRQGKTQAKRSSQRLLGTGTKLSNEGF